MDKPETIATDALLNMTYPAPGHDYYQWHHKSTDERTAIIRAASEAGITKESVGEWMNFAWRATNRSRWSDVVEYLTRAMNIHAIWGTQIRNYGMAPGTWAQAQEMLREAIANT